MQLIWYLEKRAEFQAELEDLDEAFVKQEIWDEINVLFAEAESVV